MKKMYLTLLLPFLFHDWFYYRQNSGCMLEKKTSYKHFGTILNLKNTFPSLVYEVKKLESRFVMKVKGRSESCINTHEQSTQHDSAHKSSSRSGTP
jgi:hypothetical protein